MYEVIVNYQNSGIFKIIFERIRGEGKVFPEIVIDTQISTLIQEQVILPFNIAIKLKVGNDVVGQGSLREFGKEIRVYANQISFGIPINHSVINYINESFREDYLDFSLIIDSLIQYTNNRDQTINRIIRPDTSGLTIKVSKIDWIKQVLEPMKYADFAILEMPIPKIPNKEYWNKTITHITEAETQYRMGNDPEVFSRCYAAYEAIKPLEKHFELILNQDKRNSIVKIFEDMKRFYNKGRHVETAGESAGEFPVDHRDAEFAIYITKSSIAYLAKLVSNT